MFRSEVRGNPSNRRRCTTRFTLLVHSFWRTRGLCGGEEEKERRRENLNQQEFGASLFTLPFLPLRRCKNELGTKSTLYVTIDKEGPRR